MLPLRHLSFVRHGGLLRLPAPRDPFALVVTLLLVYAVLTLALTPLVLLHPMSAR